MTNIRFAGHSAVFIQHAKQTIAIDPWLKGNPLCPTELYTPDSIDFIALTHGHADHASDVVRLARHFGCKVIATYELATLLIEDGVSEDLVVPMNKGGSTTIDGVTFTLTHAMHSNSYDSKNGTRYAGEACGVVLQLAGRCFYHAGDTALFGDMSLIAESYAPEIGFLPIGDRFTMGPGEAAKAAKLLELKTVIPIHFNTFPLLTGSAQQFQNELKNDTVEVIVLEPGQSHALP